MPVIVPGTETISTINSLPTQCLAPLVKLVVSTAYDILIATHKDKHVMKKNQSLSKNKRGRIFLFVIAGLILLAASWVAWQYQTRNYAAEVASPLEENLVEAGATKKCSRGDAGRGTDNNRPWYDVYYELPASRENAVTVINEVASSGGYKLTQASSESRGPVQVDDAFVTNWFYNTVEKKSTFDDLKAGNVELFFTLDNKGPISLSCGTEAKAVTINAGDNVSMVGIRIKLPEFR